MFIERGDACLREFTLKSGRRVDVIAVDRRGTITIVEVKSSRQDFASDRKWGDYLEWGDRFYFAVADDFPRELLPGAETCGVIITDGFDCLEWRPAPLRKLAAQRRNHLTRRLAHVAMRRVEFAENPEGDLPPADAPYPTKACRPEHNAGSARPGRASRSRQALRRQLPSGHAGGPARA
ncbi:MAG: MmcB family DNA repair protein [Pseudomonadota bacterium]|nr:MmcB family DNA repair protein [Pseudomonadota bacterium]